MKNCNTRTMEAPALAFATDSVTIPASSANVYEPAVQVAGFDPNRRSVTVVVDPDATSSVYLLASESAPLSRGVRIAPGAGFTLHSAAAVFLRSAVDVVVYIETETGSVG